MSGEITISTDSDAFPGAADLEIGDCFEYEGQTVRLLRRKVLLSDDGAQGPTRFEMSVVPWAEPG